ncbi:MAG: M17 family metallopeptidase [Saprospiraceae bacterium]
MQVNLFHQFETSPGVQLIPIAKQTDLEDTLSRLAQKFKVSPEMLCADFKAELKETLPVYFTETQQNKRLYLLGLGEEPGAKALLDAFRSFSFKRKTALPAEIGVSFLHQQAPVAWVEAAVNGLVLGFYDIGLYKTDEKKELAFNPADAVVNICIDKEHAAEAAKAAAKGKAIAQTQLEIFNLVNAPANKKNPQTLAGWATKSGKKYGYEVKVFDKKEIETLGLHALLAVNRGSEKPPTFIVMEYKPRSGKVVKKVGLVGKGVTFDTGGLSIKPSGNMHLMKSDMGGAAAVMGTLEMAAKLQLPVHLMGIVPSTDNSVDALSVKPGDVIGSYLGKTIEVIDTDAEGRLVLADGLAYAVRQFKPDVLIDLATLTGSCIRTLGTYAGGLFSNNDELIRQLQQSGKATGERLWPLPIWDDYKREIKSDVADVKNFSGVPSAGAITAAKFLEMFTEGHPAWAHLDIAGVAMCDSEFASQKSATAFGVRLLITYLEGLAP